jgi:hypothetical protein
MQGFFFGHYPQRIKRAERAILDFTPNPLWGLKFNKTIDTVRTDKDFMWSVNLASSYSENLSENPGEFIKILDLIL